MKKPDIMIVSVEKEPRLLSLLKTLIRKYEWKIDH
jgi:hypothetical protein